MASHAMALVGVMNNIERAVVEALESRIRHEGPDGPSAELLADWREIQETRMANSPADSSEIVQFELRALWRQRMADHQGNKGANR